MRYLLRQTAALTACLLLLLFVSSCGEGESKQQLETVKIGVATYRSDDTFVASLCEDLENLVKEKENETGKKIILNVVDGKNSQSNQNDQVDTFIAQSYNIICVNPVDRTVAAVIVDKAKRANIPVIFFNREPVEEDIRIWDKVYYVGTDAKESGILEGRLVVKALTDNPGIDKNGDEKLQYVMLEGEQAHQDSLIRTEYSVKTITAAGIGMEKLANDTASWQRSLGKAKMRSWLDLYGDQAEVVLSNNDDMALGAIDALKESDMLENGPIVVGIDGTKAALQSILEGELYGSVVNDAYRQAQAMLDIGYVLATGGNPQESVRIVNGQYVRIPHRTVTAENAQEELETLLQPKK